MCAPLPRTALLNHRLLDDGTQINLAWTDNSSTETGFKVERKTGSGGTYSQIATPAANATTYSDTGLTAGTTYYYRIRATNSYGDSSYSSEANATTTAATPTAPSGLSATVISGTQINLAWTDNSSTETGFKVERKTGSGGTYSQIATPAANATSYADSGLTIGNTYYYRVRATNGSGDSSYSSEANATTALVMFYIHPDHLNTPRTVSDGAGTTVWRWDNADPFGNNAANEDPDANGQTFVFNLRFPGQYRDSETNLNYNYFRDYDPSTGRYVESDPIGLAGGINTFAYANDAPLNAVDWMGLASMTNCGDASNPCRKFIDISTEYSGFCPGGCHRFSGYVQVWTCWPYVRTKQATCQCGGTYFPRG